MNPQIETVYIPYNLNDNKLCLNDMEVFMKHQGPITIITKLDDTSTINVNNATVINTCDIENVYDYIGCCDMMRRIPLGWLNYDEYRTSLETINSDMVISYYCKGKNVFVNEANDKIIRTLSIMTNELAELNIKPNDVQIVKNLSVCKNVNLYYDMTLKQINRIINKYAFSGGCDTKEEQQVKGANLEVDECYKIISKFGDNEMIKYIEDYYGSKGSQSVKILSGEVKRICSSLIYEMFNKIKRVKS